MTYFIKGKGFVKLQNNDGDQFRVNLSNNSDAIDFYNKLMSHKN